MERGRGKVHVGEVDPDAPALGGPDDPRAAHLGDPGRVAGAADGPRRRLQDAATLCTDKKDFGKRSLIILVFKGGGREVCRILSWISFFFFFMYMFFQITVLVGCEAQREASEGDDGGGVGLEHDPHLVGQARHVGGDLAAAELAQVHV